MVRLLQRRVALIGVVVLLVALVIVSGLVVALVEGVVVAAIMKARLVGGVIVLIVMRLGVYAVVAMMLLTEVAAGMALIVLSESVDGLLKRRFRLGFGGCWTKTCARTTYGGMDVELV